MGEHLRAFSHKGLKTVELRDLGRINIICGKNSSGKTTLLEAIANTSNHNYGRSVDPEVYKAILTVLLSRTEWNANGRPHPERDKRVASLFEKPLTALARIFADEAQIIKQQLQPVWINTFGGEFGPPPIISDNELREIVGAPKEAVIIPAKREVQVSGNVDFGHRPAASGVSLAQFIFMCQSRPETDPDALLLMELREAFANITNGYEFSVFAVAKSTNINLHFRVGQADWVSADNCGLGLQDLLLLCYHLIEPSSEVVLIEEPESHLHPEWQRRLLTFIRQSVKKRVFLSTHSNVFVNNALVDKVYFTRFTSEVKVEDATSRASVLDDLGYDVTDNLLADLVILVEGPTDVPVIEEFLAKRGVLGGKHTVKIWPLGGDIMDQLDLSVFGDNYHLMAIVDNDPGSKSVRNRFVRNCRKASIPVTHLKSYSIENYFSLTSIRKVFGKQIPDQIVRIESDVKLERQLGLNVKKSNRQIAREMSMDDIAGSDLERFINSVAKKLGVD